MASDAKDVDTQRYGCDGCRGTGLVGGEACVVCNGGWWKIAADRATSEVERLRLANQRLREAAHAALDSLHCWDEEGPEDDIRCSHRCGRCDETVDRNGPVRAQLRAALEGSEKE